MSLKKQTFSAVRWTMLAMFGKASLQFLQVAVLARLLAPHDFGLMALVTAVIVFAQVFTDMGVSNAIIHHQQVSQEELSSLYWLNVMAGVMMMLLVMLASSTIAGLYDSPSLRPLLMAISVYFLIVALGQQLVVVAEKELKFNILARIELTSAFVGFVVSVIWASLDPSVSALIAGMLTSAIIMTGLSWGMLADGWRPMWRLRFREISHFLGFGGYTMANNLVSTLNMQVDVLIGGRFLSAASLGVYSLPRDLSLRVANVFNPIVTRVGLPVMAKSQNDRPFLKIVYLRTLRMVSSVNFPVYLGIAAFAPEIVALMFGSQWNDAIPLLRILALWGLLRSVGNPVGSLVFAVGRADLQFKWNLALAFVVPPAVWAGVQFGNLGLALAMALLSLVIVWPAWLVLVRPLCGSGFGEYVRQLIVPLWVATVAISVAYVAASPLVDPVWRLGMGVVVGSLAYLALSRWHNRQWYEALGELVLSKEARS